MKLPAAVMACLVITAAIGGCGGGASTTTDSSAAQVQAIEKLLDQGGAATGRGINGRVLRPQEAKRVLRELRQDKGSGVAAEDSVEKLLQTLQDSH